MVVNGGEASRERFAFRIGRGIVSVICATRQFAEDALIDHSPPKSLGMGWSKKHRTEMDVK
jgi:hypothetical protein